MITFARVDTLCSNLNLGAMIKFLTGDVASIITTLLAVFSAGATVYRYFDTKKWGRKWKRFEVYHKLVEILNNVNGNLGLSTQRAALYELEHFKSYYPLTLKILKSQLASWETQTETTELLDDMREIIQKIERQ